MSDFFVGQKVVCVDDKPAPRFYSLAGTGAFSIKHGKIYTVSFIGTGDNKNIGTFPALGLAEAPMSTAGTICKWHQRRFKPLETKAIEIFRKIAQDVTDGKVVEIADA